MRVTTLQAICLGLALTPCPAMAIPVTFSWSDTVTTTGDPVPPGVSLGDPFTFTFTVDNGGSSLLSQTWTLTDFVSATINVNSGAYVGTKLSAGGGGSFQTDAAGNVIAVPGWFDDTPGAPFSDSLGNNESNSTRAGFFIIGFNEFWFVDNPSNPGGSQIEISAVNVGGNQVPANWSVALPEPSSSLLIGLGVVGHLARRRRRQAG